MQKRASFYIVVVVLFSLFMTAGCAKHDLVRRNEVIPPASAAKSTAQSAASSSTSTSSATVQATPVTSTPAPNRMDQDNSSITRLQSALEKIYFNYDSDNLSESARNRLTQNATVLSKQVSAKIRIEGNCDERGSAEYNLALGERRAKAAQQYLITLGVKPERLSIISYGKEKPSVLGNSESAWAKNRRDEFVVVSP